MMLDEPLDLSLFYQPCPTSTIINDLRRKQLEIDSSLKVAHTQGRSPNAEQEMASRDIGRLLETLAEGETLLDLSLHVLVRGQGEADLSERAERVQAVLSHMLLHAQSALFEQDRGYRSCLPYAINELPESRMRLDSASASTSLPFLLPTSMMESERGILEGVTPSGDLVFHDPWSPHQRNANRLIVAPSGSGKSFKAKLDLIRTAQHNAAAGIEGQQIVIDPEREFLRPGLQAVGGQWIRFAAGSMHQINPFDLPTPHGHDPHTDVLTETIRNAQALFDILLADRTSEGPGTLKSEEKGLLDRVLYAAYREKGITADRQTHTLPPPLLRDIHRLLRENHCGKDPTDLAARLERFVSGSLAGLFRGPTNVALNGPAIIMDTSDLDPELRPITLFLLANYIWTISFGSRIPRHLFIDELLSLYQYPEGRRFLETLFQRARKHYLGVTGMTQHLSILRESTIVSNCGSIALMGQEAAALDLLTEIFHLSPPERQHLLTFGKGDALLLTQEKRVCVHFACSDLEYRYATSHPADLARYEAEEQRRETSDETQQIAPVLPRR
jgi:type IV secretory pathway VirB4 component